jgi:hypothetical protein
MSFPRRRESRGANLIEKHFVRVGYTNGTSKVLSGEGFGSLI